MDRQSFYLKATRIEEYQLMNLIDTHAHMYHADEAQYPMVDEPLRPSEGTGTVLHLRREMLATGVRRVVLVQTGSAYRWDNRLLADTAGGNPDWSVGVCTLDPESHESVTELERLVNDCNVRGLRMQPTKSRYPLLYHPGTDGMWEAAKRLGVVICAHVQSQFLTQLADLLSRYPETPVVLDHSAYPKAAEGVNSETVEAVVALARFQNLSIKLTFLVTGSEEEFPFRDTHPIAKKLIQAFGVGRCMWGSDFPCELWLKKATYAQHLAVFTDELDLSTGEQEAILGETAARIWFAS